MGEAVGLPEEAHDHIKDWAEASLKMLRNQKFMNDSTDKTDSLNTIRTLNTTAWKSAPINPDNSRNSRQFLKCFCLQYKK